MTIETIRIELNRSEGTLLRILGLIERRGFAVQDLSMPPVSPAANSPNREVTVSVRARQAGRSVDNLACHLRKLWDVEQVALIESVHPYTNPMSMSAPPGEKETVSCAV